MNDDSDKPFEATPRRLAKARREGNVARSGEFSANLAFFAAASAIIALTTHIAAAAFAAIPNAARGAPPLAESVAIFVTALVPVACAAIAGIVAAFVQNNGLAFVAITPKLDRLNPLAGLRRILSRETLAHSGRAVLAVALATAAMVSVIDWSASALLRANSLAQIAGACWTAVQRVTFIACGVGLTFSVAEYAAARNAWLRRLRMSADERKREAKDEEGDAFARGRRRNVHRALLRSGPARVKEAAFVVANPIHVAIALEYRPPEVPVPSILVRARDRAARYVRELAASYGIPVIENAALARSLYRDSRPGEPIPVAHYVAVAEIVAALTRKSRRL